MRQLNIIEKAIKEYPISGSKTIKTAFKEGFNDLVDSADVLRNHEEEESTEKLGGFWKDLKKAGGEFVEADKIANAYIRLIEKGNSLSEAVTNLIGFSS